MVSGSPFAAIPCSSFSGLWKIAHGFARRLASKRVRRFAIQKSDGTAAGTDIRPSMAWTIDALTVVCQRGGAR